MVRALASHQCGPGSIPRPGVTSGLSLLLVLYSAPFFRVFRFSPLLKTNISKFQFDPGMHRHFKRILVNSWCSVCKQITLTFFFTHPCKSNSLSHPRFSARGLVLKQRHKVTRKYGLLLSSNYLFLFLFLFSCLSYSSFVVFADFYISCN